MRIAVIGAGVSGIAAAKTLGRFGHQVVIFERSLSPCGVWASTYPGVRLQSSREEYRYSDFDWPQKPDVNPTAEQVRDYLTAAIAHFGLDLRLSHEVAAMTETADGWLLKLNTPDGVREEEFGFVVISTGHHTKDRAEPDWPGRERFRGEILRDHEMRDLERFRDRRVAVIGLGKTAVDLATFASPRAREEHNIFREPRWLIPTRLFGRPMTQVMAARTSTILQHSWVNSPFEADAQRRLRPILPAYWKMVGAIMKFASGFSRPGRSRAARERLRPLDPPGGVTDQFRGSMAPPGYYPAVAAGRIVPHRGQVAKFVEEGVALADGRVITADLVVIAIGNATPTFPFLPPAYRALMEAEPDGVQLYRHALHPRIPRVGFVGFNHCIFHIVASEIAATWLGAVLEGGLLLPPAEEMERTAARVRDWKRANTVFDTVRSHTVANHFHQYFDVMLADLGLSGARKRPAIRDLFESYRAVDYAGLIEQYRAARVARRAPLVSQRLDS